MATKKNKFPVHRMDDVERALFHLGYVFNKDGDIYGFNSVKFSKNIIEKNTLLYSQDKMFYEYKEGAWCVLSLDELKQYIFDEMESILEGLWESKNESEVLKVLQRLLFTDEKLNQKKHLINLQNGMYNTETHELVEHDPDYYSAVQLPFEYDPNADCLRFKQFLDEVFEGDEERVRKAIEWLGYCVTSETKAQKALLMFGGGGNGKGVYSDVLIALNGNENVSNVSLADLEDRFERANLYNKLLNIASENEVGSKGFSSQNFKAIVGEDLINAAHKGVDSFMFRPYCKMVFSFNNLPLTNDRSDGLFRRLDFLPFTKHFGGKKNDSNLRATLYEELPGIFNLAMEGLATLQANDFKFSPCEASDKLLNEYRLELSPMIQFFNERVVAGEAEERVDNKVVYTAYKTWTKENGYKNQANISAKAFWREFEAEAKKRDIETTSGRSNAFRYHTGIRLIKEYE